MSQLTWMLKYIARSTYHQARLSIKQVSAWRRFWNSYSAYTHLAPSDMQPTLQHLLPCLGEDTAQTEIEPIYFYQDAWAFEKIIQLRPKLHIDVGSHHKFVALLSKVVPVTMVDIRPLSLPMESLTFQQGSILELPYRDGELPSVSSLCVVEHIGLGRYGDPLDPDGTERAIEELKRVVAPDGDLFVSLPLDDENRIYFNAHRAFREEKLLSLFAPFDVLETRYIYGTTFGTTRGSGFGVGCYHLRRN